MKKIVILMISFLFIHFAQSQSPCLPDGIGITTQEEIDSFAINYPGCTEIIGNVWVGGEEPTNISNLNGVSEITSFGGSLTIKKTPLLKSLSGLENITLVDGSLLIAMNDTLEDITALSKLTEIAGSFDFHGNDQMNNLEGLENIEPLSIESLNIAYNPLLSECHVESVCDYLVAPNGTPEIHNNAPGCNSVVEVELACLSGVDEQGIYTFTIQPNPSGNGCIAITLDNTHANLHVTCFNTFGQQIHQQEINNNDTIIDLSTWQPGIYLAVICSDGKPMATSKFVVLK